MFLWGYVDRAQVYYMTFMIYLFRPPVALRALVAALRALVAALRTLAAALRAVNSTHSQPNDFLRQLSFAFGW